jgi:hypothetical protein
MVLETAQEAERAQFEVGWRQERHLQKARLAWLASASPPLAMNYLRGIILPLPTQTEDNHVPPAARNAFLDSPIPPQDRDRESCHW